MRSCITSTTTCIIFVQYGGAAVATIYMVPPCVFVRAMLFLLCFYSRRLLTAL